MIAASLTASLRALMIAEAVALACHGVAAAPAGALHLSQRHLASVRADVVSFRHVDEAASRLDARWRVVAIGPAAIGRAAGSPCDEPGALYLSTGPVLLPGEPSLTLEIGGNAGEECFTFASGAAMSDIIAAINEITFQTGVTAATSPVNQDRIALHSVEAGADAFVSARQRNGPDPLIFPDPLEEGGSYGLTDYGEDGVFADLNCDGLVSAGDLLRLLQVWGPCPGCAEDLDNDGVVGIDDLVAMIRHWGAPDGPRRRRGLD